MEKLCVKGDWFPSSFTLSTIPGRHIRNSMAFNLIVIAVLSCLIPVQPGSVSDPETDPDRYPQTPVLTPWWNLTFAVGETAVIDCGVYTDNHPSSVTISWLGVNGKPLENSERVSLEQTPTLQTAYTVLTLTLQQLKLNDTGRYTCVVDNTTDDSSVSKVNITLTVVNKQAHCGFEDDLCGWSFDVSSPWHMHDGSSQEIIDRTKGARFDHTYGSSKHVGHFLDVDLQHSPTQINTTSSRLMSPLYEPHEDWKCMQFWYTYDGRDQVHLKSMLHVPASNTSQEVVRELWSTGEDQKTPEWTLGSISLAPQSRNYHVIFEVAMCKDKCRLAATSIDDISLRSGNCTAGDVSKEGLKVRLLGGGDEGSVEILHDGQWGSICSHDFGSNEATVICKALGLPYEQAGRIRNAQLGRSPEGTMIWLDRLQCNTKTADLGSCIKKGQTWGDTNCTHNQDAGVRCTDKAPAISPAQQKPAQPSTQSVTGSTLLPTPTAPKLATSAKNTTAAPTTTQPTTTTTTTATPSTTKPVTNDTPSQVPSKTGHTLKPQLDSSPVTSTASGKATPILLPSTASVAPSTPTKVQPIPSQSNGTQSSVTAPSSTSRPSPDTPSISMISVQRTPSSTTTIKFVYPDKTRKAATTTTTTATITTTKTTATIPIAATTTLAKSSSPKAASTTTLKPTGKPGHTGADGASPQDDLRHYTSGGNNAGVAIGIVLAVLIASVAVGVVLYRRKKRGKKSTYITFGNPSYSREHLPANDFSLGSPLTLSSNGYTVLA